MHCRICVSTILVTVSICAIAIDNAQGKPVEPVAGKTFKINTNNTSDGFLVIDASGRTGRLSFPSEGIDAEIVNVQVSQPGTLKSREIRFERRGKFKQIYIGWISSDGKIIAGHLVNKNVHIRTSEKFPFFAVEQ